MRGLRLFLGGGGTILSFLQRSVRGPSVLTGVNFWWQDPFLVSLTVSHFWDLRYPGFIVILIYRHHRPVFLPFVQFRSYSLHPHFRLYFSSLAEVIHTSSYGFSFGDFCCSDDGSRDTFEDSLLVCKANFFFGGGGFRTRGWVVRTSWTCSRTVRNELSGECWYNTDNKGDNCLPWFQVSLVHWTGLGVSSVLRLFPMGPTDWWSKVSARPESLECQTKSPSPLNRGPVTTASLSSVNWLNVE